MEPNEEIHGKRSAYMAGFDEQAASGNMSSDAMYPYTGLTAEPDVKRPRYPEPPNHQDMSQTGFSFGFTQSLSSPMGYHTGFNTMSNHPISSPLVNHPMTSPYGHPSLHTPLDGHLMNSPLGHQSLQSPLSSHNISSPLASSAVPNNALILPHVSKPEPVPGYGFQIAPSPSPAPRRQPLTRSRTQAQRASTTGEMERRVGGATFERAGLALPDNLTAAEQNRRLAELDRELRYQSSNPPILPISQVKEVDPKPFTEDWVSFPDDVDDKERKRIEAENNRIAAINQDIERDRNNQAAKKSREKRLEALKNTRTILNAKCAECD